MPADGINYQKILEDNIKDNNDADSLDLLLSIILYYYGNFQIVVYLFFEFILFYLFVFEIVLA